MREGSVQRLIASASDVEVASIVQRVWEARGYETDVRFSGPDVHVEAVGETPEGATRTVRTRVVVGGTDERDLRAFLSSCERDGVEPQVVAVRGRIDPGIVPPGVAVDDAAGLAVDVRETGVELETGGESDSEPERETDWFGDPVDDRDGTDDDEADADDEAEVTRRDALETVGVYVCVGLGGYLAVERLSDLVRSSPEFRADVRRRVADLRGRLPRVDLPDVGVDFGAESRLEGEVPGGDTASGGTRPENATRVPYHELAADPSAFAGDAVRYEGTVEAVTERDATFEIRLAVAATAADEWTDALVCRWSKGDLFGDAVSVHLLERDDVAVWGVVRGATEGSRYERSVPLVAATDVRSLDGSFRGVSGVRARSRSVRSAHGSDGPRA